MKRRILAVLILITLLIGTFDVSLPVKALADTPLPYPNYTSLNTSDKELLQDLVQGGVPLKNEVGQYLVMNVYRKYGLRVYDNANTCASSYGFRDPIQKKDGSIEYRYLGYNMKGQIVTNDNYFNDGNLTVDPSTLLDNKWVSQNGMRDSWLNTDNVVKDAMHTTPFISEDMVGSQNPKNYTLGDVLKKTVGSNYSASTRNQYTNYSFMLSPLTLSSNGSTKVVKKGANGYFYNTLTYERKGLEPKQSVTFYKDAALTQLITEYTIPVGQETATVYAKVSTNASLENVKLGEKESSFIQSVENFITNQASKLETLGRHSSITNYRDVYGVKPIELKRANYSRNFKNFTISAKANIEPASVVINIAKEINSSGTLKVKVDDPSGLGPDFDIVYDNQVVTDQSVQNDGKTITKDFTFDLKDNTFIPVGNSVKNYNYFIYNHVKGDYDYFGYTKDSQFTLKADKISEYTSNDTLTFKQLVVDAANKPYTIEHTVTIIKKEDTLMPPKAYIFPPGSVRAGERARITGKGESGTGSIVSYDFDLSSSFFIMSAKPQEKNGTFLDYDTTETSSLTVTDSSGLKATASESTSVEHPIIPVMKTNGVYKVNRTIELDSTESRGTEFYPIDYVTWTIKPLEGQNLDSIKLHEGGSVVGDTKKIVGDKPKVDFKQLGRYAVWMDVHATCTYAGQTHRTAVKQVYGVIHIKPDEPPIAMLSVPSKVIRESDPTLLKRAYFDIWDMSYSPDGDSIGKRRYFYRFDSDNDKSLTDESWTLLYEGTENHYSFNTPQVGNFEFKVEVEEANDSVTSPFWNPDTDTLRANTDGQSAEEKTTEVINVAPITSVLADRRKLDLIVATDYEGSDVSTLKSNLDLLVKDLYEQGIDIQYKLVNDMEKSGNVNAPIYKYTRYGDLSYRVTFALQDGKLKSVPYTVLDRKEWENRNLFEDDYKPNYGSEIPTTIQYNKGVNESGDGYTLIATKGIINAPEDPYKKNGTFYIAEVFGNGYSAFQNVFESIVFTLRGYFEKGGITGFGNKDLYTIKLASVMAQPLREGADKKLLFVTKNSNSLVTLNESFKEWVKSNTVEVSAISGGNLKDEYGYGKVIDIGMDTTNIYALTEMGRSLNVGNALTPMDMYPVEKSYNYTRKDGIFIQKGSSFMYDDKYSLTDLTPYNRVYTYQDMQSYNSFEMSGGYRTYTIRKGIFYIGESPIGKVDKVVSSSEVGLVGLENGTIFRISVSRGYGYYGYQHNVLTGRIKAANGFTTGSDFTMYDGDGSPYPVVKGGLLLLTEEGNLYSIQPHTKITPDTYGRSYDMYYSDILITSGVKNITSSRFSTSPDRDVYNYYDVYIIQKETELFMASVYWTSHRDPYYNYYGILSSANYNTADSKFKGAVSGSGLPIPAGSKKLIVELTRDYLQYAGVLALDSNGKVWAVGSSTASRFGVTSPTTPINPLREARSITNTSPVSLHELLGLSTQSKAYPSFTDFKTGIVSQYSSTAYEATLTRLLGDTLDQQVMYADYENDPMNQSSIKLSHDPTALENPLGTDDDNNKTLANWDGILDKTGLYTLNPKVQDSPSDDDRFNDYRLWNKDDMTFKVLVHRKPIAKQKLAMSAHATDETKLVLTAIDNGSKDLDHESEALKGITAVEWGFKGIGDSTWQITNGSLGAQISKDMTRGETYQVSYRVKDKEGEWSDPVVKEITAGAKLLLDAKLKPKESYNSLTAMPSGGILTLHDVWTSYELPHYLEVQLFDGANPVGSLKRVDKNALSVTKEEFPEVFWQDIDFTLPENLSEKNYTLRITAKDQVNPQVSQMKQFTIGIVNNRPPSIAFVSTLPNQPYEGDSIKSVVRPNDPDKDKLSLSYYLWYEGESPKLIKTFDNVEAGVNLSLPDFLAQKTGTYYQKVVVTDPKGLSAEVTKSIWVNQVSANIVISPSDPMAGDVLYFNVSTTGFVDKVEIILDESWIIADNRVSMGYKPAPYVNGLNTDTSYKALLLDLDNTKLSDEGQIRYQVWVTVPQTLTLKKVRLRPIYTHVIRAWKGSFYKDFKNQTELEGSVLQTIKMGSPNK